MEPYRPTGRVLAVLEMLQARRRVSGAEIARRLEVSPRTARRYVETLRETGVPVEGERAGAAPSFCGRASGCRR